MPQLRSEWGASTATQAKVQPYSVDDAADLGRAYFKLKPGPGRSPQDVRCHQQARIHSAMVDVVTEMGYDAATVRKLARRAGVSTRTFYQHYSSMDECFLGTQKLIGRRWLEQVAASLENIREGEMRLELGSRALLRSWVDWPAAAKLMFADAWAGGPRSVTQSRRAVRALAARCCGSDVGESRTATLFAEGTIAGLAAVLRSRLIHGRSIEIEEELLQWITSCAAALQGLAPEPRRQISLSNVKVEDGVPLSTGDRALLLSAVVKLAATGQAGVLTPKRISDTAGLSQRKFHQAFPGLKDCVAAAVEWRAGAVIDRISQQYDSSAAAGLNDTYHAASLLCAEISKDETLINLCFSQIDRADALQLHSQERMAQMIGSLISGEPARIAAEASAFAIVDVLHSEVLSTQTARLGTTVPVVAYLLLAPAIKASKAAEVIDQQNQMAAA